MNNETYDFEDRKYVSPTVSRDERMAFIDNLRGIHDAETQRIVRDTHNLGTDVPTNEGGLNGATGVWRQQYVDPTVNTMLTGLKATAQAEALSTVLSNYQNQMQKRYKDAYRAAQKRENNKNNSSSGSTGGKGITLNDGANTAGDGSGDPQEMEKVTKDNATDDEIDKQIAAAEAQLNQVRKLKQKREDEGYFHGYQWWEGLNPAMQIGAGINYASDMNKYNESIENLEKQISNLRGQKKGQ